MKIFAIGDLHLSGEPPQKPMDIFNKNWLNHWLKISTDWQARVSSQDLVLIAGDTSWAIDMQDAMADLERIVALPGHKVIVRGNHDFWWSTVSKMHKIFDDRLLFLQNNFCAFEHVAICGTRGWEFPTTANKEYYTEADQKIFARELLRVENSLQQAHAAGYRDKILVLHFPPLLADGSQSAIVELCNHYGVVKCVFGHLHGEAHSLAFNGKVENTDYQLVSSDYAQFKLCDLLEL